MNNTNTGAKILNFINKVGTAFLINLTFVVGCLPVVTIGASWSGLYSAIRYLIRGDGWFSGYKEGFKTGFLRNTLATAFGLLVGYYALDNILVAAAMLVDGAAVATATVIAVAFGVLLLAVLFILTIMVPVNLYIRTDYDRWLKNTFYLIFHAPLQCLVAVVLFWIPVFQLIFMPLDFMLLAVVYAAIYFVLGGFVNTILLKKPLIRLLEREREAGTLLDEEA